MPNPVRATKVTVEYTARGTPFTVTFDPRKVKSIVFDGQFQKAVEGLGGANVEIPPQFFPAGKGIPAVVRGHDTNANGPTPDSLESEGAPLWWVNEKGVWFHPEDES
ncbi:MAG TPA: hypothetical protein VLE53_18800 [Gemmatimonadaceae bacterium]|nr:hypothetical protein [Gemmatimonadaceae bacterium]